MSQTLKVFLSLALLVLAVGMAPEAHAQESVCDFSGPPNTVVDVEGKSVTVADGSRIVTVGGPVTEIVFALGAGDKVVGVDSSSSYPPEVTELPQVGYQRQLAAEGVLAVQPTLILATDEAGPPPAVQQLRDSGVQVVMLKSEPSLEGAISKICGFAKALGLEARGEALAQKVRTQIAEAEALRASLTSKPRVMFIYARGAGALSVSGTNTSAHSMILLAGAENAVTDYEGYKPLTPEAAIAAAPDVLMLLSRGLESVGGIDGLLQLPGLAQTPAGQARRVVAMDDLYMLGFGPRLGSAVLDMTYLLHPEIPRPLPVVLRLDGRFETALTLIEEAGQLALLSGETSYTLFVPTDEAFKAVPKETLAGLRRSAISLQSVLSYHYVRGALKASDVLALNGKPLPTLLGAPIMVSVEDNTVRLNGTAKVIETDLMAANGVIHVIDSVLIPERSSR